MLKLTDLPPVACTLLVPLAFRAQAGKIEVKT
jgi:hypothetical protein